MENSEIRIIKAVETLPLRQKVLKPFLSLHECEIEGDFLQSSFHWGLFLNNKLISIATFVQESHPNFNIANSYRLRGMATDERFQNKGYGKVLLQEALKNLKNQGCQFIWCNAREKAFPFYSQLGFKEFGDFFELPQIGPHKVMYKELNLAPLKSDQHFNNAASTWDTPHKIEIAKKFKNIILAHINNFQINSILEIGCGTGLLGLQFLSTSTKYNGIDQSEEMLNVLKNKHPLCNNVETLKLDLENDQIPELKFNFVVSSMAFHHLENPEKVLSKLKVKIKETTYIAIIDLDKEPGDFHPDPKNMGVHHFGFSKKNLQEWQDTIQAELIHYSLINEIQKNQKTYHQFLCIFKIDPFTKG